MYRYIAKRKYSYIAIFSMRFDWCWSRRKLSGCWEYKVIEGNLCSLSRNVFSIYYSHRTEKYGSEASCNCWGRLFVFCICYGFTKRRFSGCATRRPTRISSRYVARKIMTIQSHFLSEDFCDWVTIYFFLKMKIFWVSLFSGFMKFLPSLRFSEFFFILRKNTIKKSEIFVIVQFAITSKHFKSIIKQVNM